MADQLNRSDAGSSSDETSYLSGKRVVAVFNKKAGSAQEDPATLCADRLSEILGNIGASLDVHTVEPARLPRALEQLAGSGAEVVIIAGGDGSINAAVNHFYGSGMVLGILPMGTLNHFAQSIDVPVSIDDALKSLLNSIPQPIDVGEVNGKLFVNNASIGLYPEAVRLRDRYMKKLGLRKYMAMGYAVMTLMAELSKFELILEGENTVEFVKTPFLFLGNNKYRPKGLEYARRKSLTEGVLSVFYAHDVTPLGLMRIGLNVLMGRVRGVPQLSTMERTELTIRSRTKKLKVALDGEVFQMHTPLRFRILPKSLKILVYNKVT